MLSASIYSLAFDTAPKLKVEHLKRARRIFRLELNRLTEEATEKGKAACKENYILAEARRLSCGAREYYRPYRMFAVREGVISKFEETLILG